jgi:hypothetical protein
MAFTCSPIVCPPSPPVSTLPNKKLRFSDVASIHEDEDGATSASASLEAEETEEGAAGSGHLKHADLFNNASGINSATDTTGSMSVFLRVRPLNDTERKSAAAPVLIVEPPSTVKVVAPEVIHDTQHRLIRLQQIVADFALCSPLKPSKMVKRTAASPSHMCTTNPSLKEIYTLIVWLPRRALPSWTVAMLMFLPMV